MSQEELLIEGISIALFDGSSFEDLIVQLQPYIKDRILCVINGTTLQIWEDMSKKPLYITFEGSSGDLYSFRDVNDNSYVVFGLDSATVVFPGLGDKVYRTASITHGATTSTIVRSEEGRAELSETVMNL